MVVDLLVFSGDRVHVALREAADERAGFVLLTRDPVRLLSLLAVDLQE